MTSGIGQITVAVPAVAGWRDDSLLEALGAEPLVGGVVGWEPAGLGAMLSGVETDYLLLILPGGETSLGSRALDRYLQVAEESGAGLLYADFRQQNGDEISDHPLIDYQVGSLRDNFDFGSLLFLSMEAVRHALERHGVLADDLKWGGLYDLRLKLSIDAPIVRLPEPLYTRRAVDSRTSGEKLFDYVDPRHRDYQVEMEQVVTAHLRRIGAWLEPAFETVEPSAGGEGEWPVRATIVIPVRNREKTIGEAVKSALSQKAGFDFNVVVVDNHSTDGTTEILREAAQRDDRLVHLIPRRRDLGIGGCWNEAVFSPFCGRYAVQLDSDDLYRDERTLGRMVAELERGHYAMLIGSYEVVDFELRGIPPGLIDHREWTRDNGHNNALRINGLGAPRAFDVGVLRRVGFPNVSYGEDYAVALRLSRQYEIGRIYDSLYYARRWSGNSDSALPLATANRYDAYKDRLRSIEIAARQRFNRERRREW